VLLNGDCGILFLMRPIFFEYVLYAVEKLKRDDIFYLTM